MKTIIKIIFALLFVKDYIFEKMSPPLFQHQNKFQKCSYDLKKANSFCWSWSKNPQKYFDPKKHQILPRIDALKDKVKPWNFHFGKKSLRYILIAFRPHHKLFFCLLLKNKLMLLKRLIIMFKDHWLSFPAAQETIP